MAGNLRINKIQLGDSGTATNNFLITNPGDGTLKIQRGNDGQSPVDVLTIDINGKVTSVYDMAAGQLSLAASGYSKLANGLIIQWGLATSAASYTNLTFPIAFPTALLSITGNVTPTSGTAWIYGVDFAIASKTTTTIPFACVSSASAITNAIPISWIAIGY